MAKKTFCEQACCLCYAIKRGWNFLCRCWAAAKNACQCLIKWYYLTRCNVLVSYWKPVFRNVCMITHCVLAAWRVALMRGNSLFWLLCLSILPVIIETFIGGRLKIKKVADKRGIVPCLILYLIAIVPSIWLLETGRYQRISMTEDIDLKEENISLKLNATDLDREKRSLEDFTPELITYPSTSLQNMINDTLPVTQHTGSLNNVSRTPLPSSQSKPSVRIPETTFSRRVSTSTGKAIPRTTDKNSFAGVVTSGSTGGRTTSANINVSTRGTNSFESSLSNLWKALQNDKSVTPLTSNRTGLSTVMPLINRSGEDSNVTITSTILPQTKLNLFTNGLNVTTSTLINRLLKSFSTTSYAIQGNQTESRSASSPSPSLSPPPSPTTAEFSSSEVMKTKQFINSTEITKITTARTKTTTRTPLTFDRLSSIINNKTTEMAVQRITTTSSKPPLVDSDFANVTHQISDGNEVGSDTIIPEEVENTADIDEEQETLDGVPSMENSTLSEIVVDQSDEEGEPDGPILPPPFPEETTKVYPDVTQNMNRTSAGTRNITTTAGRKNVTVAARETTSPLVTTAITTTSLKTTTATTQPTVTTTPETPTSTVEQVEVNIKVNEIQKKYTIHIVSDSWTIALQSFIILVLVISRWLLPRDYLTRRELSDLLIDFLAQGMDIMEFFNLFHYSVIITDRVLTYFILTAWTVSLAQYIFTFKKNQIPPQFRKTPTALEKRYQTVKAPTRKEQILTSLDATKDIMYGIAVQDLPFFILRTYTMFKYQLYSVTVVFFLMKNILMIIFSLYRMAIRLLPSWRQELLDKTKKSQQSGGKAKPLNRALNATKKKPERQLPGKKKGGSVTGKMMPGGLGTRFKIMKTMCCTVQ